MVESRNGLFDIIANLCDKKGIRISEMCNDLDMRQGLMSDLKVGKATTLSMENIRKIADYFCISTDILFCRETPRVKEHVDTRNKISIPIETNGLDVAIDKAKELNALLLKAERAIKNLYLGTIDN